MGAEKLQGVLGDAMDNMPSYEELVVGNALQMMTDAELEEFAQLLSALNAAVVREQVARMRVLIPKGDEVIH